MNIFTAKLQNTAHIDSFQSENERLAWRKRVQDDNKEPTCAGSRFDYHRFS